jgi:hypothetical protein
MELVSHVAHQDGSEDGYQLGTMKRNVEEEAL